MLVLPCTPFKPHVSRTLGWTVLSYKPSAPTRQHLCQEYLEALLTWLHAASSPQWSLLAELHVPYSSVEFSTTRHPPPIALLLVTGLRWLLRLPDTALKGP